MEEGNWEGWLSSEYEGRREPYRGRGQVRRQHALVRPASGLKSALSDDTPCCVVRRRSSRHPGTTGANYKQPKFP
ncbi:hypothetical protein DQ354_09710 [Arthrobacter sp. AQ5-06]|nr:hypothetical protein DQ354_09710 [Arthrobacter sp. AQ5-06]